MKAAVLENIKPAEPKKASPSRKTATVEAVAENASVEAGAPSVAQLDQAAIQRRVEAIEQRLASIDFKLKIRVDLETGETRVRVIDRHTGEIIREVPPEELVKLEASLARMAGLLLDRRM